jgi:hypothetical protein
VSRVEPALARQPVEIQFFGKTLHI